MAKRIQTLPNKVPKSPKLAIKDPEDSGDSDIEDTLRDMGFPIDKSLEASKNEEEPVLKKGICRGKKMSYVAKFDSNYLKKMLTSSNVDKQTKETIEEFFLPERAPRLRQ